MKQKLLIIALVLSTLTFAGCGDKEAGEYEKGIEALEAGNYDTALGYLNSSQGEVSDKMLFRAKGLAYLSTLDYEKARDNFIMALSESNGLINDSDIDISYYLAIAFNKLGNDAEAINTLNSIIAIDSEEDKAYYLRGKIRLKQKDITKALEDYDKAIAINPNDYNYYIRIYEDLQSEGYESESDLYIDKAMSLGNKLNDYKRGVLEYYQGDYTLARNDLENARGSKNSDLMLLMYLGRTYEALGDYNYAVNIYEEALAENPTSGTIFNQLANVKIKEQDYQGALDVISNALENSDGESVQGLLYNRVVAYENLYDFTNAAKYMEEYLAKYPDDEQAQREYLFLSTR